MEDNFLNFLFGLKFQGMIAKMAEGRQFLGMTPLDGCTVKIFQGAGVVDGEGVTKKDA